MKKFENISTKPGFMKHNGGLVFRVISKKKYQFKTKIKKIHLKNGSLEKIGSNIQDLTLTVKRTRTGLSHRFPSLLVVRYILLNQ